PEGDRDGRVQETVGMSQREGQGYGPGEPGRDGDANRAIPMLIGKSRQTAGTHRARGQQDQDECANQFGDVATQIRGHADPFRPKSLSGLSTWTAGSCQARLNQDWPARCFLMTWAAY